MSIMCQRYGLLVMILTCLTCVKMEEASARPHPRLAPLAIKNMKGAISWRDLSLGRRLLNTLLDHAPTLPRFQSASQELGSINWNGFRPWRGEASGLDLKRGLTLMWDANGGSRLLIAHHPDQAQKALDETRGLLKEGFGSTWDFTMADDPSQPAQLSSDYSSSPISPTQSPQFICHQHALFLVCDTPEIEDGEPPYWLTPDLDRGAIWLYAHTPELPNIFGLPWESLEISADLSGDDLTLSLALGAGFNPLVHLLEPRSGVSSVMGWLHEEAPAGIKFSLNPNMIEGMRVFKPQHEWLDQILQLYKDGWGGDVLLTFDGGIDHPVLILNLQPHPWTGKQLAQSLCNRLHGTLSSTDPSQDDPLDWCILKGVESGTVSPPEWRLPLLTHGNELMVGFFPPDLLRRKRAHFERSEAPISFELERLGLSGGYLDPAIFELNNLNGGRVGTSTLWAALSRVLEEGGEGLVDVPVPVQGGDQSLAGTLARLSRLEDPTLASLIAPMTEETDLFIAISDLASLIVQLTDQINWTIHSYTQLRTGNDGIALELRWGLL